MNGRERERERLNMASLSLCRFIYETEKHNGVAELLEILGR